MTHNATDNCWYNEPGEPFLKVPDAMYRDWGGTDKTVKCPNGWVMVGGYPLYICDNPKEFSYLEDHPNMVVLAFFNNGIWYTEVAPREVLSMPELLGAMGKEVRRNWCIRYGQWQLAQDQNQLINKHIVMPSVAKNFYKP